MTQFIVKETENKYEAIKELQNAHLDATFTFATQASHTRRVTVQLYKDKAQASIAAYRVVECFISGASTGVDLVTTAPDGHVTAPTKGKILLHEVTDKLFKIQTDSAGAFDLDVVNSGAATYYIVVIMPNGRQVISSAFAIT